LHSLAETFKVWSGQSSGMLQFAVWTALETEGLGASLQHYNVFGEVFENLVRKAAGAPDSWKVRPVLHIAIRTTSRTDD
jgi:predicted oxidoreductase (fatty acid repression mutant protein)